MSLRERLERELDRLAAEHRSPEAFEVIFCMLWRDVRG